MKKFLSVILCTTLVISACSFSGCSCVQKNIRSDLSGKEIAKLLLANERLNADDLSVGLKDSMLASNATVESKEYASVLASQNMVMPLSTSTSGNTVSWSNFSNECNTYDFFSSYFVNIENFARIFAEQIDAVKKRCGATDYWIKDSAGKVLLKVEANEEIIFVKYDEGYDVCRRYTNEDADDVYEIYRKQTGSNHEERMLYIAGKRYEFSSNLGGSDSLYIVAENTRGYWNMFQLLDIEKNRCNIMNFVSTGNMAFTFDNSMFPEMPEITEYSLNFSTTDLSNDIVNIGPGRIDMNLGAFNGIERVETDASNVEGSEGSNNLVTGMGTLVTASGKKLTSEKNYDEERTEEKLVDINAVYASFTKDFYGIDNHRTSGHLVLRVAGDTASEQMTNFKAFLSENGLSCKYNLDYVTSKYVAAQEIAKNFKYVYKWNGYSVENYAGIEGAVAVEKEKNSEFIKMYDEVKDLKTVVTTSFGKAFEGFGFSSINSIQCGNVTLNDDKISVDNMSVVVNDTTIFDKTEKYTVCLALAKFVDGTEGDYDNAVIMQCEGADITSFDGGSSISLSQSATFTLPGCAAAGKYTVVAYVATEDGIRVSEMVPVIFSEDIDKAEAYDCFEINYKTNDKKEIRIDCTVKADVYIKPEDVKTEYTYDEMYELLKKAVLNYGYFVEDADIEIYDKETDTASVAASGASFTSGIYRMQYIKQLENSEVNGYIYLEF